MNIYSGLFLCCVDKWGTFNGHLDNQMRVGLLSLIDLINTTLEVGHVFYIYRVVNSISQLSFLI